MALALTITLEKELPEAYADYTRKPSGKALARESDRLDSAAARHRVTPITSMLSESQKALIAQMIEEGFDPTRMRLPPELWFTAAEGLKTVRVLVEHVTANLNDFKQPNPILRDLKAVETLLMAADAAQIKFHFSKVSL
jgi:hypothetical protein